MRSLAGPPRLNRDSRTRSVSQATPYAHRDLEVGHFQSPYLSRKPPSACYLAGMKLRSSPAQPHRCASESGFQHPPRDQREPLMPIELNSDPPAGSPRSYRVARTIELGAPLMLRAWGSTIASWPRAAIVRCRSNPPTPCSLQLASVRRES